MIDKTYHQEEIKNEGAINEKLYRLPEGFKFGSSASAWQTEGWTGKTST